MSQRSPTWAVTFSYVLAKEEGKGFESRPIDAFNRYRRCTFKLTISWGAGGVVPHKQMKKGQSFLCFVQFTTGLIVMRMCNSAYYNCVCLMND